MIAWRTWPWWCKLLAIGGAVIAVTVVSFALPLPSNGSVRFSGTSMPEPGTAADVETTPSRAF